MDNYKELFLMQQIYATLFSLANKLQVKGDSYFDQLTSRQYMVMLAITHLPENETTLNNIARKLATTKQSTKQLIKIIESKGYVITVPSQTDKRAVNIKITERGKNIMIKCAEQGTEFFVDVFTDFTKQEMEILWCLLKKLYLFDGEEQDGFEQEGNLEIVKNKNDLEKELLHKFGDLRKKSRNERVYKNE